MRAALEWSHRGRGWNSPRPSVGCVIVRDGVIIGGGHTQPGSGNPHAEVMALRAAVAAGESTFGATAYVTLEPCCHFGTTPPCTDALLKAGIVRVVSGVLDPNPAIAGRGYRQLEQAGVEVTIGVLADECFRAHDDFLKFIVESRPFGILKIASSLDGKIALSSGESKWVTGSEARQQSHRLRHESDAVLVGIETVLADDPALDVRLEGEWKQPAKIVLDSRGRTPLDARLLRENRGVPVIIVTTEAMPREHEEQLVERGARVLRVPSSADGENRGRVELKVLWSRLWELGLCTILIEGGAHVAGAFLRAGLVDRVVWFVAPKLIGAGREAIAGFALPELSAVPRLSKVLWQAVGEDMMCSGYLEAAPASEDRG
ncbi:MAG: diaminohydroxyphosphoribosylaminopyrimidine deaminase [Abditibacteriota bacterium]|nr:diaminohydroxyphosphoribosylaminopyrimidine deaminase [Abditibacteriota bacterium]